MRDKFVILVHGGTVRSRDKVTDDHLELMRAVARTARESLAAGARALDAVEAAIVHMEDSGILDAGKGSIRNSAGFVETDASIMDGVTRQCGAVAAMRRIRDPISAARIVLEETPHVFFAGESGEATLIGLGAAKVEDLEAYFVPPPDTEAEPRTGGTVGAVALDRHGHLAAGTSTGGYPDKLPGRVGDSPVIGASTFANERVALSATGLGEAFIRRAATLDIAMRVEYLGHGLREAADFVVHELLGAADRADGAVIAINSEGEMVLSAVNVAGMLYGYASDSERVTAGFEIS